MSLKYSPTESRLLKLLPQNGEKITTKELTSRFYRNRRDKPTHGQIYISNAMRGLVIKVSKNREKFKLKRTARHGSRKIHFWLE